MKLRKNNLQLAEQDGLITLLQQQGYKVKPVSK